MKVYLVESVDTKTYSYYGWVRNQHDVERLEVRQQYPMKTTAASEAKAISNCIYKATERLKELGKYNPYDRLHINVKAFKEQNNLLYNNTNSSDRVYIQPKKNKKEKPEELDQLSIFPQDKKG